MTTPETAPVEVTQADIDRVAKAIDDADPGYSIRLTSLVDGEAEYTLTVGEEVHKFEWHDDALAMGYRLRLETQARAAIDVMRGAGEPVMWVYQHPEGHRDFRIKRDTANSYEGWIETPLYSHPPAAHRTTNEAARQDVREALEKLRETAGPIIERVDTSQWSVQICFGHDKDRMRAFSDALRAALSDISPLANDTRQEEPARILKNALFALERQKAQATTYGGVLTSDGKTAWVTYQLLPQGERPAALSAANDTGALREGVVERLRQYALDWRERAASKDIVEEAASRIEVLSAHFARMMEAAASYIEPTTYIARHPNVGLMGPCKFNTEFPEPDELHAESAKRDIKARRDQAFIHDIIYMLDGPEQRAALSPDDGEGK